MEDRDIAAMTERADIVSMLRIRFLMIVTALTFFGLVMVYSASAVRAFRGGWEQSYAVSQISWLGVALVAMAAAAIVPYRKLARFWWAILLFCITLLALVITPLGTRVNGANRWFRYGGFNIQPSELAKVGVMFAVAVLLSRLPAGKRPKWLLHVGPLCCIVALTTGLIAIEPDFGTAALVGCALLCLLLAGGVRWWQLATPVLFAAPAAAYFGYTHFNHIKERVHDWLAGEAFHTNVSKIAVGSGGLWGVGLGKGPAKLDYLPEAHTDFIFAMVGQELGLAGALAVVLLFMLLVWHGMAIARHAADRLGGLIAFGATIIIGGQSLFNMFVVTGIFPPKGISLPFVSFGGSGLVVNYIMVGLIISVTRGATEVETPSLTDRFRPRQAFMSFFRNTMGGVGR